MKSHFPIFTELSLLCKVLFLNSVKYKYLFKFLEKRFYSGAPNDGFLPMHWKHFFRLSRVLLDLYKCIPSSAIQFVFVWSSWENLSLFEISGASVYYCPANYSCNFILSFFFILSPSQFWIWIFQVSFFLRLNSLALGVKCEKLNFRKSYGILLDKVWKFINGTIIHTNFCCPQVIENYRQYLLPGQIFYRKQSSGASVYLSVYHLKQERWSYFAGEVRLNFIKISLCCCRVYRVKKTY